jgi:CheY-like chemotaxis protein
MGPVDVNGVVEENLRLLGKAIDKRISLKSKLCEETLMVEGNPNHLSQVIVNLTLNSKDAIHEKMISSASASGPASITFETRVVLLPETGASGEPSRPEGEYVVLEVSDTGKGMERETRERAFEPFFTTKPLGKGTGLGLTMVYGILQRHGGWADIDTERGRGTRILVFIPRLLKRADIAPPPKPVPAAARSRQTVLFVDDEELLRKVAKRNLENLGYTVVSAADGREAVEVYGRESRNIDVVVLDLTMPGLTGLQVMTKIRAVSPEVPVIISSGFSSEVDAKEVIKAGATDFLPKPYAPEDLARSVQRNLARPG